MVTNEIIHNSVRRQAPGTAESPVRGFSWEKAEGKGLWREDLPSFAARQKKNPYAVRREIHEASMGELEVDLLSGCLPFLSVESETESPIHRPTLSAPISQSERSAHTAIHS